MPSSPLHAPVLDWYALNRRALPWRAADASPWAVLVSEVMLQQTPVARVLPVYQEWLRRWPDPAALAAEPSGEAVRAWGRLGYPRRALRLHEAAVGIVERHDGEVPDRLAELRALPGVGSYTAAAVASFAFGQRHVVLDTNVRRVLARVLEGVEFPPRTPTAGEVRRASALLPDQPARAAAWAVGTMELGALVCTARNPRCGSCPVAKQCAWRRAGCPPYAGASRRAQSYAGTDRHVRGLLLAQLRLADAPVPHAVLRAVWPVDPLQCARALDGLVTDRLAEPTAGDRFQLPGTHVARTDHAKSPEPEPHGP